MYWQSGTDSGSGCMMSPHYSLTTHSRLGEKKTFKNYELWGVKVVERTLVAPLGIILAAGRGTPAVALTSATSLSLW